MAHTFISYSRKEKDRDDSDQDKEVADKLAQRLRDEGFEVWIDKNDITPGDAWWEKIVEAIKGCGVFVIILSSYSVKSPWVLRELSVALEFEKPIFPLLLRDGEPWTQIKHIQCANSIDDLISGLKGTRLFVSHVMEDEGFAAELVNGLAALGANAWQLRNTSSLQALGSKQIMLLVLSPESMVSEAIREQWQTFASKGKQIIPLLVRPTTVPPKLREVQPYVDFFNQDYSIAFAQLYGLLHSAGIKLRTHEKVSIPPQPQLSLSRYDMTKEASEAIWVSGITLDTFVEDLFNTYVRNPGDHKLKRDIRLLMLTLDVKVANETGAWTGINPLVKDRLGEDLESEGLETLQSEFKEWVSQQEKLHAEVLTEEGHWIAWRLFQNQKKLEQVLQQAPNIQIRTVPHRLAMGYCIIDPDREEAEGILTASPYFYRIDHIKATRPSERHTAPIFLSNRSPRPSDRWWFAQYVKEFKRLWEDATPWNQN
jgi:hypothetical protein